MPYLNFHEKNDLTNGISLPEKGGHINFLVSDMVDSYIMRRGKSYATINEVIGALECAKLELYRRIAAPYEDIKISENGDVYKSTSI